jgi:hypothetical protein
MLRRPISQPDIALNLGHGVFTARYGNIYTSQQLLQLLRRAFGRFTPKEDVWVESPTKLSIRSSEHSARWLQLDAGIPDGPG